MAKGPDRMFVPQMTLELWVDSGRADFSGDSLAIPAWQKTYDLQPAVRILSLVEGGSSSMAVGKVVLESRIQELGGEVLGESVVFGDRAYEIRQGHLATSRNERPMTDDLFDGLGR
ncbi:MAG: hypothetical protein HYV07_24460 [Deltaproteobacteria bacterium]|nr:hypothetical protein [Deltaproteobacteria bacterium]